MNIPEGQQSHTLREMWVSIISVMYGKESYLTFLTLKLIMTMGHVYRTSPSGHANRNLNRTIGHTGHALNSEHVHRTS